MRVREHLGSGRRGDLVSASRRNDLSFRYNPDRLSKPNKSSRSRGRARLVAAATAPQTTARSSRFVPYLGK